MEDQRLTQLTVDELVARIASDDPAPGGGSAAALAGAVGAALLQMVIELTRGRPAASEHEAMLGEMRGQAARLQSELLRLVETDAAAYTAVVKARGMARGTDLERHARKVQIDGAVREATRTPLATAQRASTLLDEAIRLAPVANRNAISDVGVAGELAAGALRSALLNVEINVPFIENDDALRAEAMDEVGALRDTLPDRVRRLRDVVAERLA